MKKILAILLLSVSILGGCSNDNKDRKTLHVFNFGEYIDKDLIYQFEKEHDVQVIYETTDSNESMYTKLRGGSTYDVLVASDYIIERLIDEDYLEKIEWDKITNSDNLDNSIGRQDYDPNSEYSVPYFWGSVGILYNQEKVEKKDVTSWELLRNPKYKDRIYMYDSERDSFLPALKSLGYSVNTEDEDEINAAYEWLVEQRDLVNPIYVGDEVIDRMISGEKDIAIVYSGDAVYIMSENEDMQYYEPEEGTNVWTDSMIIPKSAKEIDLAHAFINFMIDVDNASANTEAVGYTSPVTEAFERMINGPFEKISAYKPRSNGLKDEMFRNPTDNIRSLFADLFTRVKAR